MSSKTLSVTKNTVRVHHAADRQERFYGRKVPVIVGVILPEDLDVFAIPDYQREEMTYGNKQEELIEALGPDGIGVPEDIVICVHTNKYKSLSGGQFDIHVREFIVLDGHQRIAALNKLRAKGKTIEPIGVKIFLATTVEEEIMVFDQVNRKQTPVSSQKLFYNWPESPATKALYSMAIETKGFPNIRTGQSSRGKDITLRMLFRTTVELHGKKVQKFEEIINGLNELAEKYGTELLCENVKKFFAIVKQCFESDKLAENYSPEKDLSNYMYKAPLLFGLARFFSKHQEFWQTGTQPKLRALKPEINKIRSTDKQKVVREIDRECVGDLADVFKTHVNNSRDDRRKLTDRGWE